MALYDLHRSSDMPRTAILASRAATFVFDLVARLTTRRKSRSIRALMGLSDSQLADIGLTRSDLTRG